jgi:hypothetical protein
MNVISKTPTLIWDEYNRGMEYNQSINLYEIVKKNEDFYIGRQWEGVNAPNIEKPVINVLRQAVDYYISMLVSDDVSVQCRLPEDEDEQTRQAIEYIVSNDIDRIFERTKFKSKCRDFMKNCAVDGDAYFYWRYDSEKQTDQPIKGDLDLELIDNTNIIFGNPAQKDVQKQPYILIVQKLPLDEAKEMATRNGKNPKDVQQDGEGGYDQQEVQSRAHTTYTTILTKLYKEKGIIKAIQTTRTMVMRDEVVMGVTRYPVAGMPWRSVKNAYHGESPLTSQIQNQIMINKYYMMLNEFMKLLAFPKLLYDQNKIDSWSNRVEAIGVNGNPNEAIASSSPTMQLTPQVQQYVQDLIEKTKETMGVYDVGLGNVNPDNTSAIIALQKTASQPLELQKKDYYQVVEDCVNIILELMAVNYGTRMITIQATMTPEEVQMAQMMKAQDQGIPSMMAGSVENPIPDGVVPVTIPFDYADVMPEKLNLIVEIGASAYWSELMQIQSLDNMYKAGIIPDPITYIEQLPNGIIKSKKDLIEANQKAKAEAQAMAQQQMMTPQGGIPNG